MKKPNNKEKKCKISALYGKDKLGFLVFYCNYCGEEMELDEDRLCTAVREKCPHCGEDIGETEWAISRCFNCDKDLKDEEQ